MDTIQAFNWANIRQALASHQHHRHVFAVHAMVLIAAMEKGVECGITMRAMHDEAVVKWRQAILAQVILAPSAEGAMKRLFYQHAAAVTGDLMRRAQEADFLAQNGYAHYENVDCQINHNIAAHGVEAKDDKPKSKL